MHDITTGKTYYCMLQKIMSLVLISVAIVATYVVLIAVWLHSVK
jgi:hypothetical protein